MGETPLHRAARDGNLVEVRRILDARGVDVKGDGSNFRTKEWGVAIILASIFSIPMFRIFIQFFTNVYINGYVFLIITTIAIGLARGIHSVFRADVNSKQKDGWTPLHFASHNGHKDVCALLLDRGADVHARNNAGQTALHFASQSGHKDVCVLLIEFRTWRSLWIRIDMNAKDCNGSTSLHSASLRGHPDVCGLLLDRGASKFLRDNDGETPLYRASHNGHKDVCALLLDRGADVDAKQKDGCTPLYIASGKGHKDVCALLLVRIQRQEITIKFAN
jgi:hypothetical protein